MSNLFFLADNNVVKFRIIRIIQMLFFIFFCFIFFPNIDFLNGALAAYFTMVFDLPSCHNSVPAGKLAYQVIVEEERDGERVRVFSHPRYYGGPFIPLTPHSIAVDAKSLLRNVTNTEFAPFMSYRSPQGEKNTFFDGLFCLWPSSTPWCKKLIKLADLSFEDALRNPLATIYLILHSNRVIPGQEALPCLPNLEEVLPFFAGSKCNSLFLAKRWLFEKEQARLVFTRWDRVAMDNWILGVFSRYLEDGYPGLGEIKPQSVVEIQAQLKESGITSFQMLARTGNIFLEEYGWLDTLCATIALLALHKNHNIKPLLNYETMGQLLKGFLKDEINDSLESLDLPLKRLAPKYLTAFLGCNPVNVKRCRGLFEAFSKTNIVLNELQKFLMLSVFKRVIELGDAVLQGEMETHFKQEWRDCKGAVKRILESRKPRFGQKRQTQRPVLN